MEKLFFTFESDKEKEFLIHEYFTTNQEYIKNSMAYFY
jgi:hypothetical protein